MSAEQQKKEEHGNIILCQPVYLSIIFRVLKYTANQLYRDHSLILFVINVSNRESRSCDENTL